MGIELKAVEQQTIVITGASSGIGLATARRAAHRGARVVLAARNEESLRETVEELRSHGADAHWRAVDVADFPAVQALADWVRVELGGFDTWVNNAGLSIYGALEAVPLADARRLFDVNYWGVVHGSLAALPSLRERGGALINVGSVVGERAIPLQGHYAASKHAVKGFTDALRMELEKEDAPVSVTLIKPGAIATPYPEHARSYLDVEPTNPPPLYDPQVVAQAILASAEKPVRDMVVGAGGAVTAGIGKLAPRTADRVMERTMFDQQLTDEPAPIARADSLYESADAGRERGRYDGQHIMRSSVYTSARLHPVATLLTAGALALIATGSLRLFGRDG
ncbi:MAG TPA: SDR family oxidoreductase [Longimicrobiales bacterium]|nr:SDR family oxidoreductase [Longimicrobiales bacterium]